MFISNVSFNATAYNNRKTANHSQISFKQVKPEHFFVKIKGYEKDKEWGHFVSNLANNSKNSVLNDVKKEIKNIGRKYRLFYSQYDTRPYGVLMTEGSERGICEIWKDGQYGQYYQKCLVNLEKTEGLKELKLVDDHRKYLSYQCQEKVDNKELTLTQIFKQASAKPEHAAYSMFFIHPPAETSKVLINKAQKYLDELNILKEKKLSSQDIKKAYENIGAIHWCLAQGMPFKRGSAAIADVYTKSLFESLNIQTTPWKKGIAPDWEAFLTPMDEYSKKYQSFFSSTPLRNFSNSCRRLWQGFNLKLEQ